MANEFAQARQQAVDVKNFLRDGQLKPALRSAALAVQAALSPALTKGELADLRRILEKVVYLLNFDPLFRQICPDGVVYAAGEEKRLAQDLIRLEQTVEAARQSIEEEERAAQASRLQDILDKAQAMLAGEDLKKAAVFVRKSAKENAGNLDFVLRLAQMLQAAKLHSEAYDLFEMVQKGRPGDVATLSLMGSCMRQLGKFDFAAKLFAQALEREPENPALLFNAARNFLDGHKWTQAHDLLKKALALKPDFEPAAKALRVAEKRLFGH